MVWQRCQPGPLASLEVETHHFVAVEFSLGNVHIDGAAPTAEHKDLVTNGWKIEKNCSDFTILNEVLFSGNWTSL